MLDKIEMLDILRLPVAERLALSAAIWDSLADAPDAVPVPGWHLDILDERLAEDENDAGPPETWPELRSRLEQGR